MANSSTSSFRSTRGILDSPERHLIEIAGANNSNIALAQNSDLTSTELAMASRELVRAVNTLNAAKAFGSGKEVTLQMDVSTRTPVIRIIDKETNQVVDQIPAEYILQLAASLGARSSNPPTRRPRIGVVSKNVGLSLITQEIIIALGTGGG